MIIKITFKKIRQAVFIALFGLSVGYIGYRIGTSRPPVIIKNNDLSLFWFVWSQLEEKYLYKDKLDPEKMVEGAISGMVASLDDPYTVFLTPEENKMSNDDLSGEFGGVGIQLGYKDKTLAVIAPLDGTPAQKAGVEAGDFILRIKDEKKDIDRTTEDVSLPEAVKIIRGDEGSVVTLTLAREGRDKVFEVNLVRGKIYVPALVSRWESYQGRKVAYVHLMEFTERVEKDWLDWVDQVMVEKNESDFGGVILDLRNNPGGYLQEAVFVAGEFLPKGEVVVWQEDYKGEKIRYPVDRVGRLLNIPLVVLVNEGSASAAEILAGALRDYERAEIVGTKTFGKGTVQEPEELPGKAGLHITIAQWLMPNGGSINKEGIEPNVKVELDTGSEETDEPVDLILKKGLSILLEPGRQ